ncbi:PNPT1 [Bugula neritina]|uniref:polyribonucleotide nucleotidyltransferase n=1 Tax=Bugula neritina TaxID=10212 RepID=A0A7J7KH00_BUGNE|nr:PNPT1 [Bugula neritina]
MGSVGREWICINCLKRCLMPNFSAYLLKRHKSGWSYGNPSTYALPLGQGEITVGKLAKLANGSASIKCGDTSVLATVVTSSSPTEESFLPLTVDYRQKAAATGRIPTNFLRRDLAQSQSEILTSRVIDRSLRPLFPGGYNHDTQISCQLQAFDRHNQPDVLAINAASAALAMSNIPWHNPVGAVRVGWIDNKPVLNPSRDVMSKSQLDLVVAALANADIVMLEGSAQEISMANLLEGNGIRGQAGQSHPFDESLTTPTSLSSLVNDWLIKNYRTFILRVFSTTTHDKYSRDNALQAILRHALTAAESNENLSNVSPSVISTAFSNLSKDVMRDVILDQQVRPDGRPLDRVRPISCEVDVLKPLHGSSLFQRGQTQVMASVTLDSLEAMSKADPATEILVGRSEKNFMLHYQFPQFASGDLEVKGGAAKRREIGHGALAEKGLKAVVPKEFPFTIRVSAEVLESNGSSSMASVCAGSLALLDAGVPIKRPAAGVAMGLITKTNNRKIEKHCILTDILGLEDYAGDSDFKIAGTSHGFTALQVFSLSVCLSVYLLNILFADFKLQGVSIDIITEMTKASQEPLNHILSKMEECIAQPRDRKDNWPCTESISLPLKYRGKVKANMRHIEAITGVTISVNDDQSFGIFASNLQDLNSAKSMIEELQEIG